MERKFNRVGSAHRLILLVTTFAMLLGLAAAASGQSKKKLPSKPLDLNTASVAELQQLPNVGPSTAKAIVRFREKSGPFRRVEDLLAIRGISKKRLEKIRPYVTIGPPVPADPRGPSSAAAGP